MSRSFVKAFHSHVHSAVQLIRNRDTVVIIRLNNSLSAGLSKNVPMLAPSFLPFFLPLARSLSLSLSLSLSPSLSVEEQLALRRFPRKTHSENYSFPPVSLKAFKYEKENGPMGSIQSRGTKVAASL